MSMPPLEAKLVLDSTGFAKGIAQAGDTLNKFKGIIAAASAAAAGFLAYKATDLIREQMNVIDSTAKLADRLGVATEELTALQYAGDLAGVSSEQLQTSLTNLAKTMENAGSGSKAAVDSFAKIGLAYEDLINKSPQQQLELISDGLGKVESAGNRTAIALEIFGKSGAGMVNMLGDGSAALRETTKEAEQLGVTFSRLDAAKVELANDALTKVGSYISGVLTEATIALAPLVQGVAEAFANAAKSVGGFGSVATKAINQIVDVVGVLYDAIIILKIPINAIMAAFSTIAMSLISVFNDLHSAYKTLKSVFQLDETLDSVLNKYEQRLVATGKGTAEMNAKYAAYQAKKTADNALSASLEVMYNNLKKIGEDSAVGFVQSFDDAMSKKGSVSIQNFWEEAQKISDIKAKEISTKAAETIAASQNSAPKAVFQPQVNPITDGMLGAGTQEQLDAELSMNRAHLEAKAEQESWFTQTFGREAEQRKKWEQMNNRERVASTQWMLGNMATLMNSHSKKMFQVGKAAAMANAVISTAQGAAKALELGWPMGLIAMASVIAAGAVQISTIASTQFGGGGSVSSAGGNIALVGGEPSGVLATQAGVTGNQRNELNVTISGLPDNAMVSGQFVRDLIQKINEAQADGSPILNVNMAAA